MRRLRRGGVLLLVLCLLQPFAASAADGVESTLFDGQGGRLEVQISAEFQPQMQANLLVWVEFIASALKQVYGHWPLREWQVVVAPATSAGGSDPIPWAEVFREQPTRVEFFSTARATPEQLRQAWTGYHELAHLLIPYRGWGDAWFTEGLASYYQNIMQARAGVISEQQMWQKLYDGFQRGLKDTDSPDISLARASDRMREEGRFMRVYWSGAWYFLAADTRLRLQSGGQRNLDLALAELNSCCGNQSLSVPEIVSRLDQLNRVVLFGILYDELTVSTRVPPFESIFASLGIDVVDGRVRLQEDGPGARLRQQIATGKPL